MKTLATTEDGVAWVNASGIEVSDQLQGTVDGVARQLANWVTTTQGRTQSNLFDRSSYATPRNPYQVMKMARTAAAEDDVVASVVDVTEGLMLHQGFKWESDEPDEADVFNQISRDLDLDSQLRTWNRNEFTDSAVVVGLWWGIRNYRVRGKGEQARKRKTFDIACPVAMTFLDAMRVVPLPPGPFGQDRLAWHASRAEMADYTAMRDGTAAFDPLMSEFFSGPVSGLSRDLETSLASWGVDPKRLIYLNPRSVFRHTRTKATHEAFPPNRLKPVFTFLDLKQQLIDADRVALVGAANYILLVKKGTKDDPADQREIDNAREGMKTLAKLPVIVGDHRLEIEIISPPQEHVLNSGKYSTLDSRILASAIGSLAGASVTKERDHGAITAGTAVGRLLQSRRHMMRRSVEREIGRAVVDHPYNAGKFKASPSLAFIQRNIQTISDVEFAAQVMALRTQKELSRESTLDYFGFDQATEAQRREMEADTYDDTFQTQVPFSAGGQQPEDPTVSGARGGRPVGGGETPNSPAKKTAARSKNGTGSNPSTGGN